MKVTEYVINNKQLSNLTIALISDLHGNDPQEIIEKLKELHPDYILAPGDIFEVMDGSKDAENVTGFQLLSACSGIAPTFFSPGNHELGATRSWSLKWKFTKNKGKDISAANLKKINDTGVYVINNSFAVVNRIAFGGLGTALIYENKIPKLEQLTEFLNFDGPKILLCHHPEYYKKHLKNFNIDLIVSGHAHGGQWCFFGKGTYAPGQGIFPKYTHGVHDNKLVISRGLKKGKYIPRINNPIEIVKITIK